MSNIKRLEAAILIISDTAVRDPLTDKTTQILRDVFNAEAEKQWDVAATEIVADQVVDIQRIILGWTDGPRAFNLVVTSGGTGFSAKDVTPEAVHPLIHRHAPGIVHGMLAASFKITPFAMMSRPVAGVRNGTLILTLPGSPKGAKENLQAVVKLLHHACIQAAGEDSRALHARGLKSLEAEAGINAQSGSDAPPSDRLHVCHHGHASDLSIKSHTESDSQSGAKDLRYEPTRRQRSSPYPMLSVADALKVIAAHTPAPLPTRESVTQKLMGSVLAEDVTAAESVPSFRASIVDGYAIIIPKDGAWKKGVYPVEIVSHARPGNIPRLQAGKVARITTGAPLPEGANAVVMVEDTILHSKTEDGLEEKEVLINTEKVRPGENVREIGSDVTAGSVVMKKGEAISAIGGEFGLLVSVGTKNVSVYRRPIVGVISTGDEVVQHDKPEELRTGEVRDTNRPTLLSAVRNCGFEVVDLGIVSDKAVELESKVRDSLQRVDVLITSGGVSMGELDLLKPTIANVLGGTIHFGRLAMKPGKPTTFATVEVKDELGNRKTKLIFSLPGNPASAVVTFHVFVLPSLHQASGISPVGLPRVKVTLDHDMLPDSQRPEYHRAIVVARSDGLLYAISTGGQRSSRIGSFKNANALLCFEPGKTAIPKGTTVDALMMGNLLSDVQAAS